MTRLKRVPANGGCIRRGWINDDPIMLDVPCRFPIGFETGRGPFGIFADRLFTLTSI